jgi:methyl-accepting chemotaxis protein
LRLGRRLAVAFGIIIAALLALGVVGYTQINAVDEQAQVLAERQNVKEGLLVKIRARFHMGVVYATQHLYVYDGDLKTQEAVKAELDGLVADNNADGAAFEKLLTPTERKAYDAFVAARSDYRPHLVKAFELSRAETVKNTDRDASRTVYVDDLLPRSEVAIAAIGHLGDVVKAESHQAAVEADEVAASARRTIILVALGAIAAAVALALLITRSVTVPVDRLVQKLRSVRDHDLAELCAGLGAMRDGDLTRPAVAQTEPLPECGTDEVGVASTTVNEVIAEVTAAVEAYEAMRADLGEVIGGVTETAESLAGSSQQMASTSEEAGRAVSDIGHAMGDVATGAERQMKMVEEAARAVEGARRAATDSATDAGDSARAADAARAMARDGVVAAGEASDVMGAVRAASEEVTGTISRLHDKSDEIGGIVATISGIAEQTNLLALNAAIEAARAGEQGRGFAVVAEEVRKLAEEAQTAASSISGLVGEIQAETGSAVAAVEASRERTLAGADTVERTREAFTQIEDAVHDVTGRVSRIADMAGHASEALEQLAHEISEVASVAEASSASAQEVSAATEQTGASAQEIAASAAALAETAESLEGLVKRFKVAV